MLLTLQAIHCSTDGIRLLEEGGAKLHSRQSDLASLYRLRSQMNAQLEQMKECYQDLNSAKNAARSLRSSLTCTLNAWPSYPVWFDSNLETHPCILVSAHHSKVQLLSVHAGMSSSCWTVQELFLYSVTFIVKTATVKCMTFQMRFVMWNIMPRFNLTDSPVLKPMHRYICLSKQGPLPTCIWDLTLSQTAVIMNVSNLSGCKPARSFSSGGL